MECSPKSTFNDPGKELLMANVMGMMTQIWGILLPGKLHLRAHTWAGGLIVVVSGRNME